MSEEITLTLDEQRIIAAALCLLNHFGMVKNFENCLPLPLIDIRLMVDEAVLIAYRMRASVLEEVNAEKKKARRAHLTLVK